ncbi:hypothetical protein M8818_002464 [Zalaria obscura]|uniref:Uncharacterized protein n=1 Tax=Zalaria obscura TaxID=2024903 RepID=A0ACC3SGJ7_9PEZI
MASDLVGGQLSELFNERFTSTRNEIYTAYLSMRILGYPPGYSWGRCTGRVGDGRGRLGFRSQPQYFDFDSGAAFGISPGGNTMRRPCCFSPLLAGPRTYDCTGRDLYMAFSHNYMSLEHRTHNPGTNQHIRDQDLDI